MKNVSTCHFLACYTILCLVGCGPSPKEVYSEKLHRSYWEGRQSYEDLFASSRAKSAVPLKEQVIGGIVPHHLFVGHEIARYYETLRLQSPSVVVIIGPNHFEEGRATVQLTDYGYETPYGNLNITSDIVSQLQNKGIASIESHTFNSEHSISVHTAFVKRVFPKTLLLPILLKTSTNQEQAKALGILLAKLLPKDALVLASVDFSHYLPLDVASFHDDYSKAVIEQFASDHIQNLEIDSAPAIKTLTTYLTARKAQHVAHVYHTNSADFIVGIKPSETTSHFYYAFTAGRASSSPFATLLFFGDTIVDRGVMEKITAGHDPLQFIRGKEDRFFRGVTVTGLNLEGPITAADKEKKRVSFSFDEKITLPLLKTMQIDTVSFANNHSDDAGSPGKVDTVVSLQKNNIAVAGYPEACTQTPIVGGKMAFCAFADLNDLLDTKSATDAIQRIRPGVDYVVVSIHWGKEYSSTPSDRQRLLARAFIQSGADAVIGHGPHVRQITEQIEGKPVIYSLGNFLFDQSDPRLSSGMAAALTFTKDKIHTRAFLLQTTGAQPRVQTP